jgi:orotidine-5'-phosphate decarboxylase
VSQPYLDKLNPITQEGCKMSAATFMELLEAQQAARKFVCVGLDSDLEKLPRHLFEDDHGHNPQFVFNRHIVDVTAHIAGAYKPNRAFYPGYSGYEALELTVEYIHGRYPHIPVIGDGKWNDIGNTNLGYVREVSDGFGFDAITVNPYLGMEAMKPFLDREDRGVIVLVRTSNPGAGEFQDLPVNISHVEAEELKRCGHPYDGEGMSWATTAPFYMKVAFQVAQKWNYNGNCGVVAGATTPAELTRIRRIVGDIPILIPGIGAQGGDLGATVKAGANSHGQGMIINSSRGIIFASKGKNFAQAAALAAQALHDEITAARTAAPTKEA